MKHESMVNIMRKEMFMHKSIKNKTVAKGVTMLLNNILSIEANSASCLIAYEPKAPKGLSKFRRDK